jgi:hypothetical protein
MIGLWGEVPVGPGSLAPSPALELSRVVNCAGEEDVALGGPEEVFRVGVGDNED